MKYIGIYHLTEDHATVTKVEDFNSEDGYG